MFIIKFFKHWIVREKIQYIDQKPKSFIAFSSITKISFELRKTPRPPKNKYGPIYNYLKYLTI